MRLQGRTPVIFFDVPATNHFMIVNRGCCSLLMKHGSQALHRELVIGTPQRGACPMGANTGGYVGWVVPVEYKTRAKDSSVVTVTSYFFWFSDEVIRGVTRRMEVCP